MKIAIIGCGVMGSAFARHFVKKHTVLMCDKEQQRSMSLAEEIGGESYERITDVVQEAEAIVLAVKPGDLPFVASKAASLFSEEQVLISLLAGTPVATLRKFFPLEPIVRVMPNLPLTVSKGVIGCVDEGDMSKRIKQMIEDLFQGLGLISWLPEKKVEALSSLTGAGPAFILVMIEAMIESGIAMGFTPVEAKELVIQTMEGTSALLKNSSVHPGELRWQIASPGGVSIAGLCQMEASGVRGAIIESFLTAYHRNEEMGQDIKG